MPSFHLLPQNPPSPPSRRPEPANRLREAGQSALLLALAFTVLLIFVGLATDTGIIYVSYGQLRRAVDAAALGAASQYRQARSAAQIDQDALQFLTLQGLNPTSYAVEDCGIVTAAAIAAGTPNIQPYPPSSAYNTTNNLNPDPAVCTYPVRKLVRVKASTDIHLVFVAMFRVFPEVLSISANAVAEAASLEIMLVLDISPSMAYDAGTSSPFYSATYCDSINWNDPAVAAAGITLPSPYLVAGVQYSPVHSCMPFEQVRDAAVQFVDQFVKFPYDRVGIVTFSNSARLNQGISSGGASDKTSTLAVLAGLDVATASSTPPSYDPTCDLSFAVTTPDLGKCMATDTGDGLKTAYTDLHTNSRPNALRFMILLSDGSANGSAPDAGTSGGSPHYACPRHVNPSVPLNYDVYAFNYVREYCQDGDSSMLTYHQPSDALYDADDYARYQMQAISSEPNMIVFTIGLGDAVTFNPVDGDGCPTAAGVYGTYNPINPNEQSYGTTANPLCNADGLPAGEQLLRYIADAGDGDGIQYSGPNADFPVCWRDNGTGLYGDTSSAEMGKSCGNYFYAPSGNDLQGLFKQIAQHIFTRITK